MRTSVGYSLLFLLSSSAVALSSRIDLTSNGTLSTSTSTPKVLLQHREQGDGRHSGREPSSNHSRPQSLYFTLLSPVPIEWKVVEEDGSGHGNGTSKRHYPLRFSSYAYLPRARSPPIPCQSSTPTIDLKKNNNSAPAPGVEAEKKGKTPATIPMPLAAENSTLVVPVTSTTRAGITPSPPPTIGTRRCEKLTDKQKYDLLESVGGRNQQFMANSPSEAAHFFPRLLPTDHLSSSTTTNDFSEGDEVPNFDDVPGNEDDVEENSRGELHPFSGDADYCDAGWCHEIEWKLADAIGRRAEGVVSRFHQQDEPNSTPVKQPPTQRKEGSNGEGPKLGIDKQESGRTKECESRLKKKPYSICFLEKFIPIGNCTSHGEEEIWGHEKL